jgi:hypothetical protein
MERELRDPKAPALVKACESTNREKRVITATMAKNGKGLHDWSQMLLTKPKTNEFWHLMLEIQ